MVRLATEESVRAISGGFERQPVEGGEGVQTAARAGQRGAELDRQLHPTQNWAFVAELRHGRMGSP